MSGINFDLADDNKILSITSPKNSVGGPHVVIYKHIPERWAIVALDWHSKPSLGMRSFWDTKGNPISTGYPTWFIIPKELTNSILNGLPLSFDYRKAIDRFLASELSGSELTKFKTSAQ